MHEDEPQVRNRWRRPALRPVLSDEVPGALASSRRRPLTAAARRVRSAREASLGPYETSYDIRHGYGLERTIIQP